MKKKVLTEKFIKSVLLPKTGQEEHFDAALPGFALRVTPRGTKSFVFFNRFNGKQRRTTLGRYGISTPGQPALTLAEARAKASEILHRIGEGKDPRHKRDDEEKETKTADTFEAAVSDFIEKYAIAKKSNRRWKDQQQLLMNAGKKLDAKGRPIKTDRGWADILITEITRRHIHSALDSRMAAGKPYAANRIFEVLRTFYSSLPSRFRSSFGQLRWWNWSAGYVAGRPRTKLRSNAG